MYMNRRKTHVPIMYIEGTVHPKSKFLILHVVLFINQLSIKKRDFCLLLNMMGVNAALNVVFTAPKNIFKKLNSNVSFQKSLTLLIKIMYRPCCELFYVGTTNQNYFTTYIKLLTTRSVDNLV